MTLYADLNSNGKLDVAEMTALTSTTTDVTGAYSLKKLPPGSYLITQSVIAGARATYDSDGGAADTTALVISDSPVVDADFLQALPPDTFAQWQLTNAGTANGPADNLAGGLYNNLMSYALGIDSRTADKPHFVLEGNASGSVEAVVIRNTAAHSDIRYLVEGSDDLVAWSKLAISPSVLSNSDGTETLRYPGVPSRFVRLKVTLDADADGNPEATAVSPVFGWNRLSLAAGSQTFSMPLLKPEVFSGKASSARGGALAAGQQYYAEEITGPKEGQRYEIDEPASSASVVVYDGPSPAADAMIAIRAHWTLAELFPTRLFHSGTSPSNADRVMFFTGTGYRVIWLQDRSGGARWVLEGDTLGADAGPTIVGPAEGLMVNPRTGSLAQVLTGQVRSWSFVVPLHTGTQLVGAGYPVASSPADLGMTEVNGFTSSSVASSADGIRIWDGDTTAGATTLTSSFYRQGNEVGSYWSDASAGDITSKKIFSPFRANYLSKAGREGDWKQPRRFTSGQ